MLENYVAGLSLLTTVFFEAIAVSWIYGKWNIYTRTKCYNLFKKLCNFKCNSILQCILGLTDFKNDINKMLGRTPSIYWRVCWKIVSPAFLFVSTLLCLSLKDLRM